MYKKYICGAGGKYIATGTQIDRTQFYPIRVGFSNRANPTRQASATADSNPTNWKARHAMCASAMNIPEDKAIYFKPDNIEREVGSYLISKEKLGEGGTAVVKLAWNRHTKELAAAKLIAKYRLTDRGRDNLEREYVWYLHNGPMRDPPAGLLRGSCACGTFDSIIPATKWFTCSVLHIIFLVP